MKFFLQESGSGVFTSHHWKGGTCQGTSIIRVLVLGHYVGILGYYVSVLGYQYQGIRLSYQNIRLAYKDISIRVLGLRIRVLGWRIRVLVLGYQVGMIGYQGGDYILKMLVSRNRGGLWPMRLQEANKRAAASTSSALVT